MGIAFFDMDGTLVDGDTSDLFLHYLVDKGLQPASILEGAAELNRLFFAGTADINKDVLFMSAPLFGLSEARRNALMDDCVRERIAPRYKKGAFERIAFHRERGDLTVIVTSTQEHISRRVGRDLGFDEVICSKLKLKDGVVQPEIDGIVPYQQQKVVLIKKFLEEHSLSLNDSYGYGDSVNDLQMLGICTHKYAVDPSEGLQRHPDFASLEVLHWRQ
ncbi:MAG: HAD-IB family hydrolase [Succinivibrio sp.]|nr:HAD-IB family hydrolase [Succinivibrio sp.]